MLSFEDWTAEMHRLNLLVEEMDRRIEYRMLELGCVVPMRLGCRLSQEQQDLADNDPTMKELRYVHSQYCAKRDYLRANGVLPPEVE